MRIVCAGGGPAGLYFALLMKLADSRHDITVLERNRPYDTFGWGVVFSDQTLGNLKSADIYTYGRILDSFNHWDDIDVHFKGRTIRSGGHGFCGIGRKRLLNILQARCEELGVRLLFETDVDAKTDFSSADLVVAADGINSRTRERFAATYRPRVEMRKCRFVWLGTHKLFDAFTFAFEKTEHGWFQAHAYRYDAGTSTFIVETPEPVWQAAGLEGMSQKDGIAYCERLFAKYLGGERLMSNASHLRGSAIWIKFPRIVCDEWIHWIGGGDGPRGGRNGGRGTPVVLMGDAAHTAHFSVGSGTKLALEDAIALARVLKGAKGGADLVPALAAYQAERKIEVLKIQNAARNSTEWFENVERYTAMEAEQFTYSLLTRSQRISHENLRLRDHAYVERIESWIAAKAGMRAEARPPMFTQFKARGLTLRNRIVMSPMAMYSCVEGTPDEFYLVHLGSRAHGGAGLVFTEMTCVTPRGRISPGCAGMYKREHMRAWKRIVDYVHAKTPAKIGIQLGHSGPKGSTQRGWEDADMPLPSENWPLVAASPIAYGPENQRPKAMTRDDMDSVKAAFVRAARWAHEAGFDWLELHCAHGYLLSSFLCPLTNRREDQYGGALADRCRYPLEVFRAIREVWPEDKPMSVRISAHDWAEGGNTPDDAVEIARLFKAAGCDLMDVSSGQTTREAKPIYGRMYQTPFADRIRQETGIATIAVGAIFEPDHVNSIIAAGRADLCALARPHLADPYWTLHAAAQLRWKDAAWPPQYWSGRDQWVRNLERAAMPQEVPDANG